MSVLNLLLSSRRSAPSLTTVAENARASDTTRPRIETLRRESAPLTEIRPWGSGNSSSRSTSHVSPLLLSAAHISLFSGSSQVTSHQGFPARYHEWFDAISPGEPFVMRAFTSLQLRESSGLDRCEKKRERERERAGDKTINSPSCPAAQTADSLERLEDLIVAAPQEPSPIISKLTD